MKQMDKMPFSKFFESHQKKTVKSNSEEQVFYGLIPEGVVGFIGILASNDYEGVLWSWYIDGELVEGEIHHALGDIMNPGVIAPPFVVKKNVEVKAKNTLAIDVELEVYCDGVIYQEKTPAVMLPLATDQATQILREIKDEMISKDAVGEVTDDLLTITDNVTDVSLLPGYESRGLHWTTASIVNLSPGTSVYVAVNEWMMPKAPLLPGEAQNIDLGKKGSIKRIYLKCDTGQTAQVRIHALK